MSKGEDRRKVIFDVFTESLKEINRASGNKFVKVESGIQVVVTDPIYICPLCLKAFDQSALDSDPPILTLEDNPPKSLGGKPHVLTCKPCNNTFGSKLESGMEKYLDDGAFVEDQVINSSLEVRAFISGSNMRSRIERVDEETFHVHIVEEDNPFVAKKFLEAFETQSEGTFDFHIRQLKPEAFNRACLKIAHLAAFRYFGFRYLTSPNGRLILDTLQTKTERVPGHGRIGRVAKDTKDGLYFGVVEDLRFFYVIFSLQTNRDLYKIGVIVPGWGEEGQKQYLSLDETLQGKKMELLQMDDLSYPFKPPHPNRYQFLWEELVKFTEAQPPQPNGH